MAADRFYNLLYTFNASFPGQVMLLPKGAVLFNKLKNIMRNMYQKYGAVEINSPTFGTCEIWQKTKHTTKYADNMYQIEDRYYLKPMNCPMHITAMKIMYANKSILPLSVFEFNYCFRKEKSGAVHSLLRLLRFTQDDSHIICHQSDIGNIIKQFIYMVRETYKLLDINKIKFRLSNTSDNYIGDEHYKNLSYEIIKKSLEDNKIDYYITDDGAFYGPKIDVIILDKEDREWQTGTIQLDFCLLSNLEFHLQNHLDLKEHVVLHRAVLGTFERVVGLLLNTEHIPAAINPFKMAIIKLQGTKHLEIEKAVAELSIQDVDIMYADPIALKKFVKQAYELHYNYYCIIGEKEVANNEVVVHNIKTNTNNIYSIVELIKLIQN